MPKVDLNPIQSGGTADLTSLDGYKKIAMTIVSFGVFFALLSAGQATVQPVVQSLMNQVPGVDAGGGSNQGIPLEGEL